MPRKPTPASARTEPDLLMIAREDFTRALEQQIAAGETLRNSRAVSDQQLSDLWNEFYSWSDYNSELLKVSFNNENNDFRRQYDQAGSMGMAFGGSTTKDLNNYVGYKIQPLQSILRN